MGQFFTRSMRIGALAGLPFLAAAYVAFFAFDLSDRAITVGAFVALTVWAIVETRLDTREIRRRKASASGHGHSQAPHAS